MSWFSYKPKTLKEKILSTIGLASFLGVFFGIGFIISQKYFIALNLSSSLPEKAFIVDKKSSYGKGDTIVFQLKNDPFMGTVWFGKIIYGQAGDKITHRDRDVYINHSFHGTAKERTLVSQKKLLIIEEQIIPENCFFVGSKKEDSYDSRYKSLGLICQDRIIGRAISIF